MRAGDRAQWVRALATKPEDLGSIPESHMVEGELAHKLSSAFHRHLNIPAYTYHITQ